MGIQSARVTSDPALALPVMIVYHTLHACCGQPVKEGRLEGTFR